jgi:hypothetical protein
VPDLRDLAQAALEKARLFGTGAWSDFDQQHQDLMKNQGLDLGRMLSPGPAGPSVEQAVSSGLGAAGLPGGQQAGLYFPDTPIGDISLGPREGLGLLAGLAIPGGPAGKAEGIAQRAEQNIARTLASRMGAGAQRLAARAEARALPQAEGAVEKLGSKTYSQMSRAEVEAANAEARARVQERPLPANDEGPPEFFDDVTPADLGMKDTRRYFEKFGPGAKRLDEAAQARYRANPPPATTRFINEDVPQPKTKPIEPVAGETHVTDASSPEELTSRLYGSGAASLPEEAPAPKDTLRSRWLEMPPEPDTTIEEAKRDLSNTRYKAGLQKTGIMKNEKGQIVSIPEGYEQIDWQPEDLVNNKIPIEGAPRSAWGETELKFAPSLYDNSDSEMAAAIRDQEKVIGQPWSGSRLPTGMEEARVARRQIPRAETYFDEELAKAGGDPWKTPSVREKLQNAIYGTTKVFDDKGNPRLDEAGNEITRKPFWKRVEEFAKNPKYNYKPFQNKVRPPNMTVEGWQNTPQGQDFLFAEARAQFPAGQDPEQWARNVMGAKARDLARMVDQENPEHGRYYIPKNTKIDTVDMPEGTALSEDISGPGGPMESGTGPHGLTPDETGTPMGFSEDPQQRELDKISRDVGSNPLEFDTEEQAFEYYNARNQREKLQKQLDKMGMSQHPEDRDLRKFEQIRAHIDAYDEELTKMLDGVSYKDFREGNLAPGDRPERASDTFGGLMDIRPVQRPMQLTQTAEGSRKLPEGVSLTRELGPKTVTFTGEVPAERLGVTRKFQKDDYEWIDPRSRQNRVQKLVNKAQAKGDSRFIPASDEALARQLAEDDQFRRTGGNTPRPRVNYVDGKPVPSTTELATSDNFKTNQAKAAERQDRPKIEPEPKPEKKPFTDPELLERINQIAKGWEQAPPERAPRVPGEPPPRAGRALPDPILELLRMTRGSDQPYSRAMGGAQESGFAKYALSRLQDLLRAS